MSAKFRVTNETERKVWNALHEAHADEEIQFGKHFNIVISLISEALNTYRRPDQWQELAAIMANISLLSEKASIGALNIHTHTGTKYSPKELPSVVDEDVPLKNDKNITRGNNISISILDEFAYTKSKH